MGDLDRRPPTRRAKAIPSFCLFRPREVERVQEKGGGCPTLQGESASAYVRLRMRLLLRRPTDSGDGGSETHCELAFQFSVSLFFTFPPFRPSGANFNINTAAVAAAQAEEEAQLFLGGRDDVGFPTLFNLPTPPSPPTVTILGSGNEK